MDDRMAAEASARELKNDRAEYLSQVGMGFAGSIAAALAGSGLMWLSGFFLASFFHWVAAIAFIVSACSLAWSIFWGILYLQEMRRPFKIASHRSGHYVCLCDVVGAEGRLLRQVAAAYDTVMESAARREGVLDAARIQVELPQMLWEVAARAQATSRVAVRHESFEARGNAVANEVLARRAEVLVDSRAALERSASALEQYASRVRAIDELIAVRDEAEREERLAPAYMDVLSSPMANTSADVVDAISKEAEAAAKVLADVLRNHYAGDTPQRTGE
ncbi:hypothetical protein ABT124_34120 [Streptomyces sp. NPDC001982]|uniref:hypothetical protein n=1 Tax=Streptomyces sp. NPDC001982 TaxID=3154405 RepID=UPI0033188E9C